MNATVQPAYAEFAVQSNFSFLRGASKPEELVVAAKLLGFSAIGLADRNTVAGVVRAWSQAKHIKLSEDAPRSRFPIIQAAGWCFATARPTSSPIRRTAKAGGISAAC